jgi:uncharacterized protein YndB with AHSA1/START domain
MVDIIHRLGIKAPVSKVYSALSSVAGVAGWWTRETFGNAKLGGSVEVSPGGPAAPRGRRGWQ